MTYSRSRNVNLDWTYYCQRETPYTFTTTRGYQTSVETTQGTSVPRYRTIIRQGGDATSAYSRSAMLKVESVSPFDFQLRVKDISSPSGWRVEHVWGTWFPSLPAVGSQDTSDAAQIALTRLYSRLSAMQTHSRGMQFLGELRETIAQLRNPFVGIRRLFDQYISRVQRHGRRYSWRRSPRARQQFLNAVGSTWLETSFGLMPLINDVRELSETALMLAMNDNSQRDRVVGSAQTFVAGQSTDLIAGVSGANYARIQSRGRGSIEHRVRYEAFLDWSRTAAIGSLERVLDLSGFRMDLFIPTIYELIPWSWAVDYVSNLGTVIETGCQSQSMVKTCFQSSMVINTIETQTAGLLPFGVPDASISGQTGRHKIVRSSFVRSAAQAVIPSVPFQLSFPGRPTQYANVLAVWASGLRGIASRGP